MVKVTKLALFVGLFGVCGAFGAQDANSLKDAIFGGKTNVNVRVRGEFVETDATGAAAKEETWAFTERLRLEYESKTLYGFSFLAGFEDVRAADDDRYRGFAADTPLKKSVIADPEDSEVDQAYLKYQNENFTVIGGRQKIILDDARFVGNVGWRQNQQTYDAATVKVALPFGVKGQYSYLWDINRVFGPDSGLDFESDSHLFNVTGTCPVFGTFTGFAYLLNFDDRTRATTAVARGNSSDTYGVRYANQVSLNEDYSLLPILSYAQQVDAGLNTTDYDADYYLAQLGLKKKGLGTIGAGYEELGSDNGTRAGSFRTPLATGHAWNGWIDSFLTTPAAGLEDTFLFASTPFPCGAVGKVFYHWFSANSGPADYGEEVDAVISKALNENVSVLVKVAHFDGADGMADVTKFWMQTEIKTK